MKRTSAIAISITTCVFLLGIVLAAYFFMENLEQHSRNIIKFTGHEIDLNHFLETMLNAETGQRGYIITGDENYLQPYWEAKENAREFLRRIADTEKRHDSRILLLDVLVIQKFAELNETIVLRREGFDAAA